MRLVIGLAVAIVVAGCDRTESVSDDTPIWTLVEDQRIGSVEDTAGFTQLERVLVTRDRTVLAMDSRTRIRVVDSTGRFRESIGRLGSGPGEFERLDEFGLIGDTIWTFDDQRRRVTLFGRNGEVRGTFVFIAPELAGWRVGVWPEALIADGSIVAGYSRPGMRMLVRLDRDRRVRPPSKPDDTAASSPGIRASDHGVAPHAIRDTLASIPLRTYPVQGAVINVPGRDEPLTVYFFQPLGDNVLWRSAHDGMTMLFVERQAAISEDSASFAVTKLVFGDTTISRRYAYAPIPAPDALIDSILANTEEGRYGMARDAVFHPRFRPPVSDAFVGNDGSVWLKREFSYGPSARWTVIHPGGEVAADVSVPRTHQVHAADSDYVWTTITDDNDVPFIIRHRIVKSPPIS